MEQVPVDLARWAVGAGTAAIDRATVLLAQGRDDLAVATALRVDLPPDRAAFALSAAHARRRAVADGVPGAERLVLTRESLEQASRPVVAAWRARRAAAVGAPLQDWCAGTGGDAAALAAHAPVDAVERDPGRAVLARHRAAVLGLPVTVHVGDALGPLLDPTGAVVHADPDRRDAAGRRARRLAHHTPAPAALLAAASGAAGTVLVVAAGVAWDDPQLPEGAEVAFVAVGDDLVEACLLGGDVAAPGVRARAVLLPDGHEVTRGSDPATRRPPGEPGEWLLRPHPAAVRARVHDELGAAAEAWPVARRRALLTCDRPPPDSPWWRVERVLSVVPARARAVRDVLPADRRVEIVLHGLDADPTAFLRSLGRPSTGPDDVRVHLVRRDDDAVAIVTSTPR